MNQKDMNKSYEKESKISLHFAFLLVYCLSIAIGITEFKRKLFSDLIVFIEVFKVIKTA